jgi:hypothetical protein
MCTGEANGQQATIFCHRCSHDMTRMWVAERGTNVYNECGVTSVCDGRQHPRQDRPDWEAAGAV